MKLNKTLIDINAIICQRSVGQPGFLVKHVPEILHTIQNQQNTHFYSFPVCKDHNCKLLVGTMPNNIMSMHQDPNLSSQL